MSKVALSGNASGTGTFTIASPNSNTDRTLTLPDQTGTVITANVSNQLVAPASGILFADATTQTTAAVAAPANVQTFDSTGTWTKPTGGQTMARIQVWGAGGGAARSNIQQAGGGGGGGYNELTVPLSSLGATETVTIGGGGAGRTGATGNGSTGGNSSLGAICTAYGGGGGNTSGGGGGGGGPINAGSASDITSTRPRMGTSYMYYVPCGFAYAALFVPSAFHGGAGGGINNAAGSVAGYNDALYGGAGGGSGNSGVAVAGGVSLYGGAGGVNAGNGVQPGGGGGTGLAANTNGGSGAAGRVVVTCW